MKQFNLYLVAILLFVLIIPSVALAAWWNPFTWNWNIFDWFSKPQTSIVQPVQQNQNANQNQNTTPQTITNQTNAKPVINSVSGPTNLVVGQTGTWTVNANSSSSLTYGVIWGDEGIGCISNCDEIPFNLHGQQSSTFSHVYQNSEVEDVSFYVKDSSGQIASKNISVNVKSSVNASLQITSPIGGETWHVGETHNITWQATGVKSILVDLIGYYNGKPNFTMPISGTLPASSGSFSWTINDQLDSYGNTISKPGQTFMIAIQEYFGSTKSISGYINISNQSAGQFSYKTDFDGGTLYATLYRSDDGGSTWKEIFRQYKGQIVYSVDPKNPNIIYAGGTSCNTMADTSRDCVDLFKSTDKGENWTNISKGITDQIGVIYGISSVAVDANNSNIIKTTVGSATVRSINFTSTDYGNTWTK